VNFSTKSYTPKDEHMAAYLEEHRKMEKPFQGLELKHIPRGENVEADEIAKRASHRLAQPAGVFAVWGLDILGPFPRAQGGYRYLYIAIDKFTKWVEVEPVCTIPARSAVKFIRGLVCRFGVPNRIITDNGSQFTSELFREYCASAGIKICFASIAYPRSNGQAERANAEVLKGLKTKSFNAKLEACGREWLDNLQSILWSIRTTATKPTGETLFLPGLWGGGCSSHRCQVRVAKSARLRQNLPRGPHQGSSPPTRRISVPSRAPRHEVPARTTLLP
jgi:transposase InsO family protein